MECRLLLRSTREASGLLRGADGRAPPVRGAFAPQMAMGVGGDLLKQSPLTKAESAARREAERMRDDIVRHVGAIRLP